MSSFGFREPATPVLMIACLSCRPVDGSYRRRRLQKGKPRYSCADVQLWVQGTGYARIDDMGYAKQVDQDLYAHTGVYFADTAPYDDDGPAF